MILQYLLSDDGFESLALTCKTCHAHCIPFIQSHNKLKELREHYEKFKYYKLGPRQRTPEDRLCWLTWYPDNISSAFNLIARIAAEPDIAHYIKQAEFEQDCQGTMDVRRDITTRSILADESSDEDREEAVIRMLANSSDLKRAGIDWKEYWAAIEEDLNTGEYSQHCATFVLTLLPNLRRLRLPTEWCYGAFEAPDRLLDTVIFEASLPGSRSSLSQLTTLEGNIFEIVTVFNIQLATMFNIEVAAPFLTLPCLKSFEAHICASANSRRNTAGEYGALESVSFRDSYLDELAVGNFVQHTPNLKSFVYSYSARRQVWDICKMIKEIESGVGSHLEELYLLYESKEIVDEVTGEELNVYLAPGKASLHGFQRLRRLQLPLEVAVCNLNAATADCPALLSDLVPASVSHLSFFPYGTDDEAKALDLFLHAFSRGQLPALQELHLYGPLDATELYEQSWVKVADKMEESGIVFVQESNDGPDVWQDREELDYLDDV